MKAIIALFIVGCVFCSELLITKEYIESLKETVTWEVADYEDNVFRGWTLDDVKSMLGTKMPDTDLHIPNYEREGPVPNKLIWQGECIHEVRNQGHCGSCWTFGTTGMLSDRCCLMKKADMGWLAPQELVSCDIRNNGCYGGWPTWALQYIIDNKGMVSESYFPYTAKDDTCKKEFVEKKEWEDAHKCKCTALRQCLGVEKIIQCLQTGPVAVTFEVCRNFFAYKSGIYKCNGYS